jgi:endoglucanase
MRVDTGRIGVVALALVLLAAALAPASASGATSYTASLGTHGGARWTVGTSVYVNLKAMTPGVWKQQLWSGTCAAPVARIVALPSLVVPATRTLAKTTSVGAIAAPTAGLVLRLLRGTAVVCGVFLRPGSPPPGGGSARGVNLVGMEMGWADFDRATGPLEGTNYPAFDPRLIDYLAGRGVNTLMFLFSWEGMQSELFGPIPAAPAGNYRTYFDNYQRIVNYATGKGLRVVIAPWNALADGGIGGATYRGELVGSAAVPVAAFTDFWTKMANAFRGNPNVWFRLIAEPHDMSTMQWWTAAQAAVTAIRATGATQTILVPGNDYTAASAWTDNWYDTAPVQRSNAFGYLNANGPGQPLSDPRNNTIVEVHTYLDTDEGGSTPEITSVTAARQHLSVAVGEARARGYKLFVGEIGMYAGQVTNDGRPASAAWADFVAYTLANADIIVGWTWWAAGEPGWWDDVAANGGGHYAVTPTNGDTYTGDTVNMTMIRGSF